MASTIYDPHVHIRRQPTLTQTYPVETQAGMLIQDNQDRIHIDANGNWSWTAKRRPALPRQPHRGSSDGGSGGDPDQHQRRESQYAVRRSRGNDVPAQSRQRWFTSTVALIVISVVAPAAVGLGTALSGSVWTSDVSGQNPPSPLPPSGGNANVARTAGGPGQGSGGPRVARRQDLVGGQRPRVEFLDHSIGHRFAVRSQTGTPSRSSPARTPTRRSPADTVTVDESLTILGGQSFPGANQAGARS